jgi:hypothetical protein
VEHEMFRHTVNHYSHRNYNQRTKKNLETIPVKHSIDSVQKTAVLGTSHVIRKVVGFTTGSREKVPGKTYEKRNNNNN